MRVAEPGVGQEPAAPYFFDLAFSRAGKNSKKIDRSFTASLVKPRRVAGFFADVLLAFCGYCPMESLASPMSKLSVSPGQANFGQCR